ncbi:MAG: hypothetical protein R2748_24140 [Bryobacterales bacterium]
MPKDLHRDDAEVLLARRRQRHFLELVVMAGFKICLPLPFACPAPSGVERHLRAVDVGGTDGGLERGQVGVGRDADEARAIFSSRTRYIHHALFLDRRQVVVVLQAVQMQQVDVIGILRRLRLSSMRLSTSS